MRHLKSKSTKQTPVRKQMDHPVRLNQIIPNSGADDIGDDAEFVWIAAWCSPERKANDRVLFSPRNFDDDCMHIARVLEEVEGEIRKLLPA